MPLLNYSVTMSHSVSQIRLAQHRALLVGLGSDTAFASSRIRKQIEDSIIKALWTTFTLIAVCASWRESDMLMEELTTMLSSTTRKFETGLGPLTGMCEESIRTADRYQELLGELTPTPSRMETWFTRISTTPPDLYNQTAMLDGGVEDLLSGISLRLRMLAAKRTFLQKSKNLIRELWWSRLETSPNSQIGSFQIHEDSTSHRQGSQFPSSPPPWYENSEEDWENPVGESCTSGSATHVPSLKGCPRDRASHGPRVRPIF